MVFSDSVTVRMRSGNGGDGHVSFRRELYVPNGGPDGGDGGKGGDVIVEVDNGLFALSDFRHNKLYAAKNGMPGSKRRRHGAKGDDLIIKVPEGTVLYEANSGKVIADMSGDNKRQVIIAGGRGGCGNMHYATSSMQVPRYASPGREGTEITVRLELKLIADVGLVGFPNVGKSTLLSHVSNARPEIADYHFTTLSPHPGVVELGDGQSFVMADLPGLIEGASSGAGLGYDFLKHIERTRLILHVVDAASTEGRDPVEDVLAMQNELFSYSQKLADLPQFIAANKIDAAQDDGESVRLLRERFSDIPVFPISAVTGYGLDRLISSIYAKLLTIERKPVIFKQEYFPENELTKKILPFQIEKTSENPVTYTVQGPLIEKMLGYTNLESEKGFAFFQRFMKDEGILESLEKSGISDGDTVRIYGFAFTYYKD